MAFSFVQRFVTPVCVREVSQGTSQETNAVLLLPLLGFTFKESVR